MQANVISFSHNVWRNSQGYLDDRIPVCPERGMHFWTVWAEATTRTLSSVALVIFVASCAAQTLTPVAISQSTDNK